MAKIVVCEDDPMVAKAIQTTLRSSGHELHQAADGVAGLELVERERPALILTDVAMPGLSGLELADAVRARPHLAHIPILLVSASAQRAELEEAYRHGIAGYVTKPFRPPELRQKVEQILARGVGGG
jgi:two-component system cell cycle response regulator DivK